MALSKDSDPSSWFHFEAAGQNVFGTSDCPSNNNALESYFIHVTLTLKTCPWKFWHDKRYRVDGS